MGNMCCKKPENESLNTIESETKVIEPIKDNYPHDSDTAFKSLKKGGKINTEPLSNENMIVEEK